MLQFNRKKLNHYNTTKRTGIIVRIQQKESGIVATIQHKETVISVTVQRKESMIGVTIQNGIILTIQQNKLAKVLQFNIKKLNHCCNATERNWGRCYNSRKRN